MMRRPLALAALLIAAAALFTSLPLSRTRAQDTPDPDHVAFVPYWTTEEGFTAVLHIRNVHTSKTFTARPFLYSPGGEEIPLPPLQLLPQATVTLNLATALAGLNLRPHQLPTTGAAAIRYRSPDPLQVRAELVLTNKEKSLVFTFPFLYGYANSASKTLEGYWWLPSPGTEARLVLFNSSDQPLTVSPTLFAGALSYELPPIRLPARAQRVFSVSASVASEIVLPPAAGGLRLTYAGPQFSLHPALLLFDEDTGFSHQVAFLGHDVLQQEKDPRFAQPGPLTLYAPHVAMGEPAGPGFPPGTLFRPQLILRNTTERRLSLTTTFTYMRDRAPVQIRLPIDVIFENETLLIDLYEFVENEVLPPGLTQGSLALSYEGRRGDLLVGIASVDASLNYVFPSRTSFDPQLLFPGIRWRADGVYNTMITVLNVGAEPRRAELTLLYNDAQGRYQLPPVQLSPGAFHVFDLEQILATAGPDPDGNLIPPGVTTGSFRLQQADLTAPAALVADVGLFSPSLALCDNGITPCCGFVELILQPNPLLGFPGESRPTSTLGLLCDGTEEVVIPDLFSSSDPAVISITQSGLATCHSVGTATLTAEATLTNGGFLIDVGNIGPLDQSCLRLLFLAFIDGEVIDVDVSLSPASVPPESPTTVTVTVLPAKAGRGVSLTVREVANSGGHLHLARLLGTFTASSGTTDAQGKFTTTYTASQFGGAEIILAISGPAAGGAALDVQVPGLPALGPGTNYALIGSTTTHPNNHFGVLAFNTNLTNLAAAYHNEFPALDVIGVNDMSLVRGGLFDLNIDWNTPHIEHRLGINADIRAAVTPLPDQPPPNCGAGRNANAIPADTAVRLRWIQLCGFNGILCELEFEHQCREHYHLTLQ